MEKRLTQASVDVARLGKNAVPRDRAQYKVEPQKRARKEEIRTGSESGWKRGQRFSDWLDVLKSRRSSKAKFPHAEDGRMSETGIFLTIPRRGNDDLGPWRQSHRHGAHRNREPRTRDGKAPSQFGPASSCPRRTRGVVFDFSGHLDASVILPVTKSFSRSGGRWTIVVPKPKRRDSPAIDRAVRRRN